MTFRESYGNPTAGNRSPLTDGDPRRHTFRPWSLDPKRCRVTVKVGTGYTICALPRDRHEVAA